MRLTFLDGLRGYASIQVLLSHYVFFFAPAIMEINPNLPHYHWENWFINSPLFFFINGTAAVSIFFLISGLVLTYSFRRGHMAWTSQVVRRLTRLNLPMAVSLILASMWFFIIPSAHVLASEVLNDNDWLRTLGPNHVTVIGALYEIFTAIILGHNYDSLILPYRVSKYIGLTNVPQSFNSPIWTLHIEFYGSMLVLLLVELENKLKRIWHRFICGAIMVVLLFHPLELFVVGYVLANLMSKPIYLSYCETLLAKVFGISLLIFGIIMASVKAPLWFTNIFSFLIVFKKIPFFLNAENFYSQIGAILFFAGVLSLSELQNFLSNRLGSVLGRYSFSLYLVHFPILVTINSLIFVILSQYNIAYALIISFLLSFILTGITTFLFERFVERPSIELSRAIRFGESK